MSDAYQQQGENTDALVVALNRAAAREIYIGQLEGQVMVARRALEMAANPLLEPDIDVIRKEAREALDFIAGFGA